MISSRMYAYIFEPRFANLSCEKYNRIFREYDKSIVNRIFYYMNFFFFNFVNIFKIRKIVMSG